jgi:DNA-binding transcriptional regulator YhcF (GntR family)
VLPFRIDLVPGVPVYEQLVAAVTRAVVCGDLKTGDAFPSVRALSQALRINPNTAQKAVAQLTTLGLLQVHPGIGTRVAQPPPVSRAASTTELRPQAADLVLEARRRGLSFSHLQELLEAEWQRLEPSSKGHRRG